MSEGPQDADWTGAVPVLLVSRCRPCGHRWYLGRTSCPRCGATDLERLPARGPGRVAAATVVHRRSDGGGAAGIALVDLEEGVRAMVRCPAGTAVGQEVTVGVVDEAPPGGPPRLVPAVLGA
ncbi:MAG: Zn-ribbon domain-containing OB-fold protein, partial [Acidimicrobiales bacterium]